MANMSNLVITVSLVICISVLSIHVVDGGNCKYIPHCDDCTYDPNTMKATCFKCDPLFGLTTEYGFSKCKNCTLNEGCSRCRDFTVCDQCKDTSLGPDLKGVATCSPCGKNCRSCKVSGGGKCDTCSPGAKKINGICETCDIQNCNSCDDTLKNCVSCNSGYRLQDNQCAACVDKCRICSISQARCDFCKDGYFAESDTGLCKACPDNCKTCGDFDTCSVCNMGFYLDGNTCSPCGDDCLSCNGKNDCQFCRQGKAFNGRCKCADNCKSCQNLGNGKCDTCEDGYVQSDEKGCRKADNAN